MKNLFFALFAVLFMASCANEPAIQVTEEQENAFQSFMVQLDDMSRGESPSIRAKLLDFYEVATANNCDPGAFDIITPEDVLEYVQDLGFDDVRTMHDWTVDYGLSLRAIAKANPDWDQFDVADYVTRDVYFSLDGERTECEFKIFKSFNRRALEKANTYGVYVTGWGYREISDAELYLFGGAFNTFVRMQDFQEACDQN